MIGVERQSRCVMIWLSLSAQHKIFRCRTGYIRGMKALCPSLLLLFFSCSTKPAGEQSKNTADSVGNESPSSEMASDKADDPNGNFIPHMMMEGDTVRVMLKGVDMKFKFPAGGEALEKRGDGFGFTYPRRPGTNLNLRRYRFTAHSP